MELDIKDGLIGVLLIAVVGLSGGLGFVVITSEPGTTDGGGGGDETYSSGIPDDWSAAPNSSYIILNNQTDSFQVSFEEILEEVNTYLTTEEYSYESGIELQTVVDPDTNIPITGISIADLLDVCQTYFPGDIEFISAEDDYGQKSKLTTTAADYLEKSEGDEESMIIGIAADKKWLKDSQYGDAWGDFTLIAEGMGTKICNLKEINVLNNWTVDVVVDGDTKLTLQPDNLTAAEHQHSYTYTYERSDDWSYNRTFWGVNLSTICEWVGLDQSDYFEVHAYAADGWATPKPWDRGYNTTEIFEGLAYDSKYWAYINESVSNPDGVPMPQEIEGLPIMLAYAQRLLGEENPEGETHPRWPDKKMMGVRSGPYECEVPGAPRGRQVKWINKIEIDTVFSDFKANTTSINLTDSESDWVRFDFTGDVWKTPANYFWTFNSTLENATTTDPNDYVEFEFTSAGLYSISLNVTDSVGNWATKTKDDYIQVVE